jgi:hypothetical protein
MEAILAWRFSPFNFSVVPGFPNVVPTIDEWGDYLPRFREDKDDNPADHLLEFHEVMHQLGIHHEDVLMNMFMYSLEGDAHEWYRSLPLASISSLKEFHATFSDHCKRFFPADLLFENCCEEFDLYMQKSIVGSSSSMNEKEVNVKQVGEESSPCEIFSSFSVQEEIFIDCSDDKKVDQDSVETFDIISDISNSVFYDEIDAPKVDIDQATIMQSISQGSHEMEDFEVQVSGIFKDQPISDKSPDDEEQSSTMIQMELLSSDPVYDSCEAYVLKSSGGDDIEIQNQQQLYQLNIPICDNYESGPLNNSEGNILVDEQNGMLLPTVVLTGGFSVFYHEVDITQLKSCTFINKIKSIQQTYSFEDQIEINIDAHYQKGYGSRVFSDPVAVYMQSNWIKEFLSFIL